MRPLGMVQVFAYFAVVGVATVVGVTGAVVLGVLAVASWADDDDTGDYQLT